jgi:hypothetical protein
MTKLYRGLRSDNIPFRDFCLWDYTAQHRPISITLHQHSLLFDATELCDDSSFLQEIFGRIQEFWGPGNTVWGIKSEQEKLSFELYFYDYDRVNRRLGMKALASCLSDVMHLDVAEIDARPWFMASVEIDSKIANGRFIDSLDLYFEGEGGTIGAGVSEVWDGKIFQSKNDYQFFRRHEDGNLVDACLKKLNPLPSPFKPGRYNEEIIVLSRKRRGTGVYFSRVSAENTLEFMRETKFSRRLTECFARDIACYQPYLYDVGIDYSVVGGESLLRRSAVYGVF